MNFAVLKVHYMRFHYWIFFGCLHLSKCFCQKCNSIIFILSITFRNAIQTYFLCSSASSHQTFTALEILFLRIIVTAILTVNLVNSYCHIGKLQPIQEKPYEPGQLVINRLFGCRAIVMKYWNAKLVEKNLALGNVDIPKEKYVSF